MTDAAKVLDWNAAIIHSIFTQLRQSGVEMSGQWNLKRRGIVYQHGVR